MKNYGLIIPEIITEGEKAHYILGSSKIKGKIINPSLDWGEFLPMKEPQRKRGIETMACAAYGTLNSLETLLRAKGYDVNYSDRYLAIVGKVDPYRGSDPHKIVQCIRNTAGCLKENRLPFSDNVKSVEDYYNVPQDIIAYLMKEGQDWWNKWELKHEWCFQNGKPNEKRLLLQEALSKGTVCVSVNAWHKNEKGVYYKQVGTRDNHWCQLISAKPEEYQIFDSYDNYIKTLTPDYDFSIAKVYYLTDAQIKLSILEKILKAIAKLLPMFSFLIKEEAKKKEEEIKKVEKPKASRIKDFAKAIEEYENTAEWRKNPGAIKSTDGKFLEFKTYEEGLNYLYNYIKRVIDGKHLAYSKGGETTLLEFFEIYSPANDNNNPVAYCDFIANKLGVPVDIKIKELS